MADDEIWGVRKACAESLVSLSQAVSPGNRTDKLVPIFEKLAEDVFPPPSVFSIEMHLFFWLWATLNVFVEVFFSISCYDLDFTMGP